MLGILLAVCFDVECANNNFQDIRNALPMEIEIINCSEPYPFSCLNENFLQVEKALRLPLRHVHDWEGVQENFEKISEKM